MPMIATTTSSSSSEKPRQALGGRARLEFPVPDVGIDAFAAFLAVGPVREHIELAMLAGVGVLIRFVPGIQWHARQLLLPVRRTGLARIGHERLESVGR